MLGTLKLFLTMHVGFSVGQFIVQYFAAGGSQYYGGALGFLAFSPLQAYVALERTGNAEKTFGLLDFMGVFGFIQDTVSVVKALLWFDYDFMDVFDSGDGLSYWLIVLVRLVSWVGTYDLGIRMAQLLFSSGLLQSATGIALVGLGAVATLG